MKFHIYFEISDFPSKHLQKVMAADMKAAIFKAAVNAGYAALEARGETFPMIVVKNLTIEIEERKPV